MNYAIIIDSSAALPESFIQQRNITILPLNITVDGESFTDPTSEEELLNYYNSGRINVKADIDTRPLSAEEMKAYFLTNIIPNYDVAICQSVSRKLSDVYDNINQVANTIAKDSRKLRDELEIEHPFRITNLNSGTTGAGQGLIAIYAESALSRGMDYNRYKIQVSRFKSLVKGFTVVKDVVYSRNRARLRGQDVVNLPTAVIGKLVGMAPIVLIQNDEVHPPVMQRGFSNAANRLFEYAIEQITNGLYFGCINIGIAGSKDELNNFPSFKALQQKARENNIKIMISVLSLASSINFSPGCIALGIAPKNQDALP